jgi:hypothetical protein
MTDGAFIYCCLAAMTVTGVVTDMPWLLVVAALIAVVVVLVNAEAVP